MTVMECARPPQHAQYPPAAAIVLLSGKAVARFRSKCAYSADTCRTTGHGALPLCVLMILYNICHALLFVTHSSFLLARRHGEYGGEGGGDKHPSEARCRRRGCLPSGNPRHLTRMYSL